MRSRWSPSVFDPQHEVSDADLTTLLSAARWAPSCGNTQPWAFVVARRGNPAHDALVGTLSRGNSSWVPRASVVLITAARVGTDPDDGGPAFSDYAEYDLGQAAAHLTLQAHAMGLFAHQFAGFDHERLTELLDVPRDFKVMTGIAVGAHGEPGTADERTAAREERGRVRRELPEFVHLGAWGTPWSN